MKEAMIFCPSVKGDVYKKDCIAMCCPYHAFWNGRYQGGAGCEYKEVKEEENQKGGDFR